MSLMEKGGENNYYKCQLLFLLLPPGLRWALWFGITSVPWADRLQSSSKDSYLWPITLLPHRSLLHYAAKSLQSCLTLCNPIDSSHQAPPSVGFSRQEHWRTVWRFLKKLEIELPYNPAIPLLGIHTEETRIERGTCTPVFIEAVYNSQDMEAT